jgi:2-oxoglutarate ferredoxin oxidoreductase subunit beta
VGFAETIHACNRGENIAIIFINNGIYGMTGGQMAPTTLKGMKSSTSPNGREVPLAGNPLDITKLLAQLEGVCYATRQAVHTVGAVRKTKKAIQQAFENSMNNKGTSIVEVVSTCSAGWKMTPADSNDWMVDNMFPAYPMGDLKNE